MRGCDILFLTFVLVGLFPLLLLSTVMTGKKNFILLPSPQFFWLLWQEYFFFALSTRHIMPIYNVLELHFRHTSLLRLHHQTCYVNM